MTKVNEDLQKKVAAEIEVILLREKLALQPFIHRSIGADTASVRLVSTEEEEVTSDNPAKDVKQGADKTKAKGAGVSNGAVGTKSS